MLITSWLRSVESTLDSNLRRCARAASQRKRRSESLGAQVEMLEDRTLLSGTVQPDYLATSLNLSQASYVADQVMVGLRSDGEIGNLNEYLAGIAWPSSVSVEDASVILSVADDGGGLVNVAQVSLSAGADVFQAIEGLVELPEIAYASPNYFYQAESELEFIPNDPLYASQYHHSLIGNPTAWNTTLGSSSIIVGVTDTGVDWDHVDLAANIWSNPGEVLNGSDDDGNGYADDVRGWDFVNNDNDPDDPHYHGTHVSGTAAARTNNGIGVAGNAGGSTIMPLRIGTSPTSFIYAGAFRYAADNGAHIVNTSFNIDGRVGDPTFTAALQYLYDHDVLHFNSAGNNSQMNPASSGVRADAFNCQHHVLRRQEQFQQLWNWGRHCRARQQHLRDHAQ